MQNTLKKLVSSFVTFTTIVSSVGVGALALPSVASAATLASGDLVKASGPAVYLYVGDGKRYTFPNETTFKSWYKDFSGVKTISDADLATLQLAGNVTMRAGTYLAKITTDPKVYALSPGGQLHWVQSEAIALALYGANWAKKVVDVPDAFFTNYSVGASLATATYPDGTLLSKDGNLYVVSGGNARKLASAAAVAANGLNAAFAVATTMSLAAGSDVTDRESGVADPAAMSTATVTSGGSLTASLASDTPAGMTVTKNASSVPLVKVNLTAGAADALVTGLRFHRVGIGAVGDFSNVYLYDGSGKRLSTGRSINSTTNLVEFNSVNATVKAGTTWSALVYGDFSSPASTGGQHSMRLEDASAVMTSGGAVSGSFPIAGQTFTVGTASSGRLDVLKGSTPTNPTVGSKQAEVSNFKLVANTNDLLVKQISLYQNGTVSNADVSNFNLYQGSTMVATTPSVDSTGHIVLNLNPAYLIGNGQTKVFSLKADVGGRADRTIRTYVEYTTDVTGTDTVYGSGAAVDIAVNGNMDGSAFVSCVSAGNAMCVTTQGGQLTNSFNGPSTANVAKGKLAAQLYSFSLTSAANNLEVRNTRFTLQVANGSPAACLLTGSASTAYFRSLKLKNLDTGATVASKDLGSAASQVTSTVTFTDTYNLSAGQTLNLAFVADLSNSEDVAGQFFTNGTCMYQVVFNPFQLGDVKDVNTGEQLALAKIVPNTALTGNAQTVKSSGLSVALASNPVSGTIVKNQANVAIAGLSLTAAVQSDITITSLTLTGSATLNGGVTYTVAQLSTLVSSLKLMDGTTQVGLSQAPDTTLGTAQISNMNLVIPKGTTKNLTVVAALTSSATTTSALDKIAVGVAAAADIAAQDGDSNSVVPTLSAGVVANAATAAQVVLQTLLKNGTLSVQADSHPVSNIVVAGKDTWVNLAQYKATAQYEDIVLDRIAVYASTTAPNLGDSADYVSVAIAQGGVVKGQDVFASGASSTKDIDLSANKLTVPKDGTLQFQVWVKLAGVQASSSVSGAQTGVSRSGHAPQVGLAAGVQTGEWSASYAGAVLNMRANGSASGERIYAASTNATVGNAMILRKSQPIVTKQALSSATLSNTDQDLIRFQVSADAAGSIAWKQAAFSISKSSLVGLTNFRLRRGSSDIGTGVVAILNATSTADLDSASDLIAGINSAKVVVAFKANQEEAISGSGNVYTLHATVSGAASGQNVTTQFYRDASNPVVTGYVTSTAAFGGWGSSASIFHIDGAGSPDSLANATGTFVWSDNSDVPHSPSLGTAGGSGDWTNDLYVQDLSQAQTVSL